MMLMHCICFILLIIPTFVQSQCYSRSSQTWICNSRYQNNSITHETIFNNYSLTEFIVTNYQLEVFKIDQYPSTLRILNASDNRFRRIIITTKHRLTSNLRQLILESNEIEEFNSDTIVLPQSLEKISLAKNRLKILDPRLFAHLTQLREIDLRHNQLKRVLPQLLIGKTVRLEQNPLDCQCTSDSYRDMCERATSIRTVRIDSSQCRAPYFEPRLLDMPSTTYLRFAKFTLTCPISGQPPPLILWSTPFGNLTSINSTVIDLLYSNTYDDPIYVTLTVLAGPLTARTQHTLHAFNGNRLSVTKARAALQHRLACSGINMLGTYTYEFDFDIETHVLHRALWQIIYTAGFGVFMALVAGALCVTLKRTQYHGDHLKTPPIYPTMAPNSAARTPPNFELNQWLSLAAANISGTLEQVRDKLRMGVQQVSEHMGQTMGRASELFTYGVQHAGGTIRQAAETSAAYLHSFRETSQQRLNTMRVQTMSSLRHPGHLMRAGMNMLTTQVNSLRDYCGVITGHPFPQSTYLYPQRQQHQQHESHQQHLYQDVRYSPAPMSHMRPNLIPTIMEDDEINGDLAPASLPIHPTPYAGFTATEVLENASVIGQLDRADNSALFALNNFQLRTSNSMVDMENTTVSRGQMSGGIGLFHGSNEDDDEDLINEPERLIIYGEQRPMC